MAKKKRLKYIKDGYPMKLVIIFLLLSLGFSFVGYLYYENQKQSLIKQVKNDLTTISDYKANEIDSWLDNRLKHANSILKNKHRIRETIDLLNNPGSEEQKQVISDWLQLSKEIYGYNNVTLYDNNLKPVISIPPRNEGNNNTGINIFNRYLISDKVIISDLYQKDSSSPFVIDIIIPIKNPSNNDTGLAAVLAFELDAQTFIFPTLLKLPSQYETMESLIAQKEGDHIIFLNELKFEKNTTLKLKIPLSDSTVIAVQAANGKLGITSGTDYRKSDVLADIKRIENTSWFLITKIDRKELETPILIKTRITFLYVFFSILLSGIVITLIWRNQNAKYFKSLYEKETEKEALTKHYAYLTKYANDIIFLEDANFNFIEVNDKALECYGYTKTEFQKMNIKDVLVKELAHQVSSIEKQLRNTTGLIFEAVHIRKDGSTFPVEVSIRIINVEGETYYQSIIRDVTERKKAEDLIRKNEALTNSVINNSPVGITIRSVNGKLISYNKAWQKIWNLDEDKVKELEELDKNRTFAERYSYFGDNVNKIIAAFDKGEHQYIPEIKVDNPYSGTQLWLSLYIYPIGSNGKFERIVTLTQDITEQKNAEI